MSLCDYLFLDRNEVHEGPIKLLQSVSLSVRPSVSDTLFSELAHLFFLIFCMKLGYHKGTNLTEPDFSGKFEFGRKWPKTAQNSQKMRFLVFFSKLLHLFFLIFCIKLEGYKG